jgi:L-iditol 2-dehydrogenase
MRAAIFYGPGDLRIEEVPEPTAGPGELVVDIGAATTCGTDLKSYKRGHPAIFPKLPDRFGHEFSGTISQVGEGVKGFDTGDRVVCGNSAPCGNCFYCSIDRQSLCENLFFLNGAFAEKILVPAIITAKNTHHLPEGADFAESAMVEPLACVVHGIAEAPIQLGQTVVVNGAGSIGCMFARLSALRGATVISTDLSDERLALARKFGAAETINVRGLKDPVAEVRRHTPNGRGADVAVEAVGLPETWEQTIKELRPGGTAVLFGGAKAGASISIDATSMHYEEYTIKGVFHHAPRYVRTAAQLLGTRVVDARPMLTDRRPLERLVETLEDMAQQKGFKYGIVPSMVPVRPAERVTEDVKEPAATPAG